MKFGKKKEGEFTFAFVDETKMLPFIMERLLHKSNKSQATISKDMGKHSRTVVNRYLKGKTVPNIHAFNSLLNSMGFNLYVK